MVNGPDWYARDVIHFSNLPNFVREAKAAALVVACWGAGAWDPEFVDHVFEEITTDEAPWPDVHCFGLTADGSPIHPMARGRSRIPDHAQPVLWKAAATGGAVPRSVPRAPAVRFSIDPADIPAEKVARRLHLTPAQFDAVRTRLFIRGFPRADPDTGMYCLEAIDRWRLHRHTGLFPELTTPDPAVSGAAPKKSLGAMAREAHERRQPPERIRHD